MDGMANSAVALANDPAICDLRSDTVTRPDEAMRAVMATAPVGDDTYGDDPSVLALEAHACDMLGKAQAVFFSSGTQSNLAALLSHCQRGEEIIVGSNYHVLSSEAHGASVLGGIALQSVAVETNGSVAPKTITAAIRPDDPHYPISRLVCLENTVRGQPVPLAAMQAACRAARAGGLSVHLDGARFFNATTALSIKPKELAATADTVSLCLSKGLAAPAGTLLLGSSELIGRARRWRKMLGGSMRQIGILAAAGHYALKNNVTRLADDHRRADALAKHLLDIGAGSPAHPPTAKTGMVFLTAREDEHLALRAAMAEQGVLLGGETPLIRIVLHKDIDDGKLARICEAFSEFYRK